MTGDTELSRAISAGTPDDVFQMLQDELEAPLNVRIFSCSVFDLPGATSKRIFTNRPDIYPLSGRKPIVENRWTRIVLDQGEAFVANTLSEISEVFPDHELIGSVGCGSVINFPVTCAGRFLGTVNMLSAPGEYTEDKVQFAGNKVWLAQVGFMLNALLDVQS